MFDLHIGIALPKICFLCNSLIMIVVSLIWRKSYMAMQYQSEDQLSSFIDKYIEMISTPFLTGNLLYNSLFPSVRP